jgi:hypothetical protein
MGHNGKKKDKKGGGKRLAKKLQTLDIDEGLRIEESTVRVKKIKIFVNKNASGIFVVQLVVNDKYHNGGNDNIKYFDSAEQVVEYVNLYFNDRFIIVEY